MSPLENLPDELLGDIIERIHATSPTTILSIGLTCKKLRRIAHPLQWEHIVLPWRLNKNSPIARFIKLHHSNPSIRTLRLQPQTSILNAFRVGLQSASHHIDALCACLSSLTRLDTFSIYLTGQINLRCYMPGPVLARIVRALPPTLAHLELDTECVDRIFEDQPVSDPKDHLCQAISEHLPRLETLRLRLSCICLDLFAGLSSSPETPNTLKLRRAFIRLDCCPDGERNIAVPEEVCDCTLPLAKPVYKTGRGNHAPLARDKIKTHLLDLQASGAFPELERFILWSWRTDFHYRESYCHVQDIATRTITHYPKMTSEQVTNRYVPEMSSPEEYTVYMIRDHDREDFFGGRRMMESALLHEVSWEEEPDHGVRRPPASRLGRETRLYTEGLVTLDCMRKREEEGVRAGGFPCLPNMEAFAGAKVAAVQM
jgi:hypothetical protein